MPTAKEIVEEMRRDAKDLNEATDIVDKYAPPDEEEVKIRVSKGGGGSRRRSTPTPTPEPTPTQTRDVAALEAKEQFYKENDPIITEHAQKVSEYLLARKARSQQLATSGSQQIDPGQVSFSPTVPRKVSGQETRTDMGDTQKFMDQMNAPPPPPLTLTEAQEPSFTGKVERAKQKAITEQRRSPGEFIPMAKASVLTIADVGVDFAVGATRAVTAPIKMVLNPIETVEGVATLAIDPEARKQVLRHYVEQPGQAAGELFVISKFPEIQAKVKDIYVGAGSKYVPPETVFDPIAVEAMQTGKKPPLPLTTGSAETIAKIEAAGGKVVTASPAKLKGDMAGIGKKAALGLEDPGVYTTELGGGSPAFTRISEAEGYSFSINPKKVYDTDVPTATVFQTKGAKTLPKEVTDVPGFEAAKHYQMQSGDKGVVYVTKRSQLGQGELAPQYFENPLGKDFKSPWKVEVLRKVDDTGYPEMIRTTDIKKGDLIKEFGTGELEAVIPLGQTYSYTPQSFVGKLKGFDTYTTLKGRNVAIREATLNVEGTAADMGAKITGSMPKQQPSKLGTTQIKESQILQESSSLRTSPTRSTTPGVSTVATSGSSNIVSTSTSRSISSVSSSGSIMTGPQQTPFKLVPDYKYPDQVSQPPQSLSTVRSPSSPSRSGFSRSGSGSRPPGSSFPTSPTPSSPGSSIPGSKPGPSVPSYPGSSIPKSTPGSYPGSRPGSYPGVSTGFAPPGKPVPFQFKPGRSRKFKGSEKITSTSSPIAEYTPTLTSSALEIKSKKKKKKKGTGLGVRPL